MTKISTQVAQVQKVAKYTRPLQSNRHLPWCFLSFQWDPTTLGSGKPGHFIKLDRRKSSVLQRCFSVCFEGQATKTERLDDWWWLDILDLLPFAINRSSKCMCVCVCAVSYPPIHCEHFIACHLGNLRPAGLHRTAYGIFSEAAVKVDGLSGRLGHPSSFQFYYLNTLVPSSSHCWWFDRVSPGNWKLQNNNLNLQSNILCIEFHLEGLW